MKTLAGLLVLAVLAGLTGCAMGPVQMAKTEAETFKTRYDDPELAKLYTQNEAKLKDIYARYRKAGVNFYYDGLGVTAIRDAAGKKYPGLMVNIRPMDVVFDENTSTGQKRFAKVLREDFPKYIKYLNRSDYSGEGIYGVAFGIYWPVRDYTQCNVNGGFIEYAIVYLSADDANDVLEGRKSFFDVAKTTEVITSLDLKPAVSVRVVEQGG